MTKQEWLGEKDVKLMFKKLKPKKKRQRLFFMFNCLKGYSWKNEINIFNLELLEKYLRDEIDQETFISSRKRTRDFTRNGLNYYDVEYGHPTYLLGDLVSLRHGSLNDFIDVLYENYGNHYFPQILREVFNPFHKKRKYSKDLHNLAKVIDKSKIYQDYPVLHDMLLDEGCEDEELLNHLLEEEHSLGCWALRSFSHAN